MTEEQDKVEKNIRMLTYLYMETVTSEVERFCGKCPPIIVVAGLAQGHALIEATMDNPKTFLESVIQEMPDDK